MIGCAVTLAPWACVTSRAPRAARSPSEQPSGENKTPPIDLDMEALDGAVISLGAMRGSPVVVMMFSTWSLRCQSEAPQFVKLHEQLGPRGLRMIGVALDLKSRDLVKTYVDFVGFRFPVVQLRPDDARLMRAFGPTRFVPRTLLISRDGRVVEDHRGGITDFDRLQATLARRMGANHRQQR